MDKKIAPSSETGKRLNRLFCRIFVNQVLSLDRIYISREEDSYAENISHLHNTANIRQCRHQDISFNAMNLAQVNVIICRSIKLDTISRHLATATTILDVHKFARS